MEISMASFPRGEPAGCGTLYRLTPAGVFTKLHDFRVASGIYPENTPDAAHELGKSTAPRTRAARITTA